MRQEIEMKKHHHWEQTSSNPTHRNEQLTTHYNVLHILRLDVTLFNLELWPKGNLETSYRFAQLNQPTSKPCSGGSRFFPFSILKFWKKYPNRESAPPKRWGPRWEILDRPLSWSTGIYALWPASRNWNIHVLFKIESTSSSSQC